jgi:hypothetical protein
MMSDHNGADLLNDLEKFTGKFLALPNRHCLTVLVLWIVHTWAVQAVYVSPRLVLDSPEPGSGKTRVLEILALLCRSAKLTLSTTTAAADQAAAKLAKIMTDLSPDGDTAAELRAGRFWDRTKPLLDNAKEGAVSRAQKLITTASREELGTLLQELPAYLEARNQPTSWIESAVSQAVPEYGQAVKRNRLAQKALTIAKYNADNLCRTFAEGHAGSPLVLADLRGYDPDKAL